MSTESPLVARARSFLAGSDNLRPDELLDVANKLQIEKEFGLAAHVLERGRASMALDPETHKRAREQQAVSTYKDPDLPTDSRLDAALRVLCEDGLDLETTRDQESLGIAGAIYKRKWEWDAQIANLERSLGYYLRGEHEGPEGDFGYTAINAAFVLDILAHLEDRERSTRPSAAAERRREQARKIRTRLVAELPEILKAKDWLRGQFWFWATLGEASFGLLDDNGTRSWLAEAAKVEGVGDWERESTIRQLAWLQSFREPKDQESGRSTLTAFLADFKDLGAAAAVALDSLLLGKVGLALSGGGFRASLFHIGVLARLAELDLLRHVEVLSCVSGGSIIGAHYYLELRHLLQSKPDSNLTQQDYVEIVRRLEREFLAGVQRNLRMRIGVNVWANLRMLFAPGYSRTHRLGELYEQELYARVPDGSPRGTKRFMDELFVAPRDEPPGFHPRKHNWRRNHKVPQLILNATTLNTGHNWQFTASFLGEPPGAINTEVDGNERLRRAYYDEAPDGHRKLRLGYAVAASSCVPGLFAPLTLKGFYDDRIVRLVDGGMYDNQGIAGLIEQDCTVMLVSDASGQMDDDPNPTGSTLAVLYRTYNVLQERLRGAQFREIAARRRASLLKGLLFVHLKKDLDPAPVDWHACGDPSPPASNRPLAAYGLRRDRQRELAAIRTDLDSFNDLEAYALMASGYHMTRHELETGRVAGFAEPVPPGPWRFLEIENALTHAGGSSPLPRLPPVLKAAAVRAFKIWRLELWLRLTASLLALPLVYFAGVLVQTWWSRVIFSLTGAQVTLWLVGLVLSYLGLKWIVWIVNARKTLDQWLLGVFMTVAGWVIVLVHLHVFDRLYLRYGRVKPR